jgi:hypothetical protein
VKGDVGYAMPRDEKINQQTFPLLTYAFIVPDNYAGDIFVRP